MSLLNHRYVLTLHHILNPGHHFSVPVLTWWNQQKRAISSKKMLLKLWQYRGEIKLCKRVNMTIAMVWRLTSTSLMIISS